MDISYYKIIKQLDCFVPAHLHLAEDRKKELCSLRSQQFFLSCCCWLQMGRQIPAVSSQDEVWAAEKQ